MKFLHYEVNAGPRNIVRVHLDKQANVRLVDSSNFRNYQAGREHRYYGGSAKQSPVDLVPPHSGKWHVVVDLGGYSGTVKARVEVL